ncbi:11312_t:CDS:1, partial [Acaulospora colombiana]
RPSRYSARTSFGVGTVSVAQLSDHLLTRSVPKTREGYYHFKGGIEAAIKRSNLFAPYADLLWLETKKPDLQQAQSFARRIRNVHPGK